MKKSELRSQRSAVSVLCLLCLFVAMSSGCMTYSKVTQHDASIRAAISVQETAEGKQFAAIDLANLGLWSTFKSDPVGTIIAAVEDLAATGATVYLGTVAYDAATGKTKTTTTYNVGGDLLQNSGTGNASTTRSDSHNSGQ